MKLVALSFLVCTTGLLLGGCGDSEGPQQIGRGELEIQTRQALAKELKEDDDALPNVQCPSALPAKVGATTRCSIGPDVADKYYRVYVKVTKVRGKEVDFQVKTGSIR